MNKLIVMCGLPASGKSTYAKELATKENTVIHASDELREELFGNANDNVQNDKVFQELHKRIKEDLKSGKNVVYDATNINYKRRMTFLREIKNIPCEKIAVVMATTYEDCLTQNKIRDRQVPEYVITKMYKNFYVPQMYEGWDKIKIIYNFNLNSLPFDALKEKISILQDNPHHTLTIYDHCVKCQDNVKENVSDTFLGLAALFHDIGKVFTKQFKNAKGEDTDIAHYYNHHLVSAYDSLFYLKKYNLPDNDILKIVNYITWHMQPFFMKEQKAIDKFVRLVGQEFYDELMILHEADKNAK